MPIKPYACLVAVALAVAWLPGQANPLERSARTSALVSQRLINSLSAAGNARWVAVGQRGHILSSVDDGVQWQQRNSPVSSDLTAVQFLDPEHGYAVGHDGVVLATTDGGARWSLKLDGKTANALALAQLKAAPAGADHERLLAELQRNVDSGPDKPFLDLYFTSANEGFVIGAYNLIFQTRDGGKTWESWYDRTENNESLLNMYAIRPHRNEVFIVGEAGLLLRLDTERQRFVRVNTGYNGSFFGLLSAGDALIAHGMRGNAVISHDGGHTWAALVTGLQASITASAQGPDGSLWLADQIGNVRVSRDGGRSFAPVQLPPGVPVATMQVGADSLLLAGPRGVRRIVLKKE